jgi:hypothetical protein
MNLANGKIGNDQEKVIKLILNTFKIKKRNITSKYLAKKYGEKYIKMIMLSLLITLF